MSKSKTKTDKRNQSSLSRIKLSALHYCMSDAEPSIAYLQDNSAFINNEWHNLVLEKIFPVYNPSTEEDITQVSEKSQHDSTEEDITQVSEKSQHDDDKAVVDISERGRLLNILADLIERDRDILAAIEHLDNGKPFDEAYLLDLASVLKELRYTAGWADKLHGTLRFAITIPTFQDLRFLRYTRHEPVGVCGEIIPWNIPLLMYIWKIGPALAAGNTVVLKPEELTPLTALTVATLIKEAGFPPGVVNVVSGYGPTAGAACLSHKDNDKLAFTGSTLVGKVVMKAAAKSNLKKVTLELGGKSPMIVFIDADLDWAVENAHFGVFFNQGQCCIAQSRITVHESIYDEIVERDLEKAKKQVLGNPFESDTRYGPQILKIEFDSIPRLINSAKAEGAKVLCGGGRDDSCVGYYIQPTVFADVTDEMRIAKEEIFGPVITISRFKSVDEAIKRVDNTKYGLAAYVFTKDKAIRISAALKAGTVWVNCVHVASYQIPFGGNKNSGMGRELGEYGLE
uniref:Aldehyde dehydrogenase 2, mitochondrial n=1 Tax=Saccharomyces cerevisiae TaxID=4932 RepID=ALDHY_YEASX|nr:RecName: Full=Aldehyde dehydrogenase 2, mitochondrial; Flags: Precursor [Saccharomyces cerevisiae]CAA78962.1 aldehyde dehydrogenase [Saccharomyces cerevisiae]